MRDRVASGAAAVVLVASLGAAALGAPQRHSQAAGRAAAAAWPTPQEETFQGCPPQGDGGDGQLNIRKNRIDSGAWQAASLSSLLTLTWPRTVERAPRSSWSASDADVQLVGAALEPDATACAQRLGLRDLAQAQDLAVEAAGGRFAAGRAGEEDMVDADEQVMHAWLGLHSPHCSESGRSGESRPGKKIAVEQGGKWTDLATGKRDVAPAPGAASTLATGKPSATSAKSGLQVRVTVQPNPTSDGTSTTVQATTSPGAQCTVRVVYASGSAWGSASLNTTHTAGSGGSVSWTWKPSTRRPGPATATVHCTLGSQSADGTAQFTVQG